MQSDTHQVEEHNGPTRAELIQNHLSNVSTNVTELGDVFAGKYKTNSRTQILIIFTSFLAFSDETCELARVFSNLTE